MIAPFSPIAELAAALRRGELSCEEIAEFYLARIARYNDKLNAFVTVFAQTMLTAAQGQDLLLKAGVDLGPLQGMPLGIKDLLHWRGTPCSASSRQLPDSRSTHTAPAVTRLLQHGAVIAGKPSWWSLPSAAGGSIRMLARRGIPGIVRCIAYRADPPADRLWRWRRAWCRRRSAPIPAARCVFPPR